MSKQFLMSTIADTYLISEQSLSKISFTYKQSNSFTKNLKSFLKSFKEMTKISSKLLFRHIQALHERHFQTLATIFQLNSPLEMWQLMTSFVFQKQQKIKPIIIFSEANDENQIIFLNYLFLTLQKIKLNYQDNLSMNFVQDLTMAMQILFDFIIEHKKSFKQIKYDALLRHHQKNLSQQLISFNNYSNFIIKQFQNKQKQYFQTMQNQLNKKNINAKTQQNNFLHSNIFNITPQLNDTKNIALIAKLSPYKWQAKRRYSQDTYKKDLKDIKIKHQLRKQKKLFQYQQFTTKRIINQTKNKINILNASYQSQRNQKNMKLMYQKDVLFKKNKINIMKEIHKQVYNDNKQIINLKKRMNSINMSQESHKIQEIIKNHKHKVQFCNDIQLVDKCNVINKTLPIKYSRLQSDQERQIKKKLFQNFSPSLMRNTIDISVCQKINLKKSLTNLYDKKLQLAII